MVSMKIEESGIRDTYNGLIIVAEKSVVSKKVKGKAAIPTIEEIATIIDERDEAVNEIDNTEAKE